MEFGQGKENTNYIQASDLLIIGVIDAAKQQKYLGRIFVYYKMIKSLNENKKAIHQENEMIARVQETGCAVNRVIQETRTAPNDLQIRRYRNLMDYECESSFCPKVLSRVTLLEISVSFNV